MSTFIQSIDEILKMICQAIISVALNIRFTPTYLQEKLLKIYNLQNDIIKPMIDTKIELTYWVNASFSYYEKYVV